MKRLSFMYYMNKTSVFALDLPIELLSLSEVGHNIRSMSPAIFNALYPRS